MGFWGLKGCRVWCRAFRVYRGLRFFWVQHFIGFAVFFFFFFPGFVGCIGFTHISWVPPLTPLDTIPPRFGNLGGGGGGSLEGGKYGNSNYKGPEGLFGGY